MYYQGKINNLHHSLIAFLLSSSSGSGSGSRS